MQLHRVITIHGTELQADEATGLVCHGKPQLPGCRSVIIFIPDLSPHAGFLISANPVSLRLALEGDYAASASISVRLSRYKDSTAILRHPLSGFLLCAEPTSSDLGKVVINRTGIGPWERFTFVPTEIVSKEILIELHELSAMLQATRTAPATLDYLLSQENNRLSVFRRFLSTVFASRSRRSSHLPPQAEEYSTKGDRLCSVLRLLQPYEMDWLGRALGRDRAACLAFASFFKNDVWAQGALTGLTATASTNEPSKTFEQEIETSLDHLAVAGFAGKYVSVTQMCNAFARRDRAPVKNLCVLATARNEGLYLLEWIAHHRALGVEAFFIYTNDNDDGSDDLLAALVRAGIINWIRNRTGPGVSPQYKAYGHAFQVLPDILEYRWVGVLDIDEFIVLDPDCCKSITAFIADLEVQKTDAIMLNWLMFGSSGHSAWSNGPVTRRFLTREPGVNRHVKSLCRPSAFIHAQCHYPVWDDYTASTFRSANGRLHPRSREGDASAFSPNASVERAWIHHYHTKSAQEYALRRSSGRGDVGLALTSASVIFTSAHVRSFMGMHTSTTMDLDRRAVDCVPSLEAEMQALRDLPGVNAAMVQIEASYVSRLNAVSSLLRLDPRFQVAGSAEGRFAEILGEQGSIDRDKLPAFDRKRRPASV